MVAVRPTLRRRCRHLPRQLRRIRSSARGGPMSVAGREVELVDLVKTFDDVVAVDGINLHMPAGEFFSLLGPSGCGKTTTLRIVAGFERPTRGRVLLGGVDMAQTPPHKRNVNTVFQ